MSNTLLLFAVAAVAFIGVLNVRGVWRTVVASLLALFCLGAALHELTRSMAEARALAGATAVPAPAPLPAAPDASESTPTSDADLQSLVARARSLRDSLASEDPTRARSLSDSGYQAFERRSDSYLAEVRRLRDGTDRLTADPPPGMDEAVEYLSQSLQSLLVAARDLNRFFHAESKDEEKRLFDSFRQNAGSADTPLRQAEGRLGNPSPDSAP